MQFIGRAALGNRSKFAIGFIIASFLSGGIGGCVSAAQTVNAEQTLAVVSSFSILSDMVTEVGGNHVTVHNLVPIGTDPHSYEPLPEDLKKATEADLMFYNGLNLEGGKEGWFYKLVNTVSKPEDRVYEATLGIDPLYFSDRKETPEPNPHAFVSPVAGLTMVENIRDALIEVDPVHADDYARNAEGYLESLRDMDSMYVARLGVIPAAERILVTSERAFQYMAAEYGLQEGFIWAVDTDENGSPEQIRMLVDFVRENEVKALLVESNVDTRPMRAVSAETGIPIVGVLYSDEIGSPGEEGDTYLAYLRYNLDVIASSLDGG